MEALGLGINPAIMQTYVRRAMPSISSVTSRGASSEARSVRTSESEGGVEKGGEEGVVDKGDKTGDGGVKDKDKDTKQGSVDKAGGTRGAAGRVVVRVRMVVGLRVAVRVAMRVYCHLLTKAACVGRRGGW